MIIRKWCEHEIERCNWNLEDIKKFKSMIDSNNIPLNDIKDAIDDIIDFGLPYQDDFLLIMIFHIIIIIKELINYLMKKLIILL